MAWTKTNILTDVKARLSREDLASIDTELLKILLDLAARVPGMLQKTSAVTVSTAGVAPLPTDFVRRKSLIDSSGKSLEFVRDIDTLLNQFNISTTAGTPEKYSLFSGSMYVWPKPAAETTLTLLYDYKDTGVSIITLPDDAREAATEGVCHQIELGKGSQGMINAEAITHLTLYDRAVEVLKLAYQDRA